MSSWLGLEEFLSLATHQILWHLKVYPRQTFAKDLSFGDGFVLWSSKSSALGKYIERYTKQAQSFIDALQFGGGRQIFVIEIHSDGDSSLETSSGNVGEPLRRFEFEFQRLSDDQKDNSVPIGALTEFLHKLFLVRPLEGVPSRFQFVFKCPNKNLMHAENQWVRLKRSEQPEVEDEEEIRYEPIVDPVYTKDGSLAMSVLYWDE